MSRRRLEHRRHRFVILFVGRSGSTYLVERLHNHPHVTCLAEALVDFRKHHVGSNEQLNWVNSFYTDTFKEDVRAVGFKTKLQDILDRRRFRLLCQRLQVRIILLTRKNVVKQAVSLERAILLNKRTNKWNLYSKQNAIGQLAVSYETLAAHIRNLMIAKKELLEYGRSFDCDRLELTYKDLLSPASASFARVWQFLGVNELVTSATTVKHTSDDLRLVLSNYEELCAMFHGTEYEEMLREFTVGER